MPLIVDSLLPNLKQLEGSPRSFIIESFECTSSECRDFEELLHRLGFEFEVADGFWDAIHPLLTTTEQVAAVLKDAGVVVGRGGREIVSERLRAVLTNAGWSTSRTFDFTATLQRLRQHGYEAHNSAIAVVAEFGGLTLRIEEVVSRKGELVSCPWPVTVHLVDGSSRFQLPPWINSKRDTEPADRHFLRWKYGWNACYVGFLNHMYWGGTSGAALYSLETGEAVLVDAAWSNLYVHRTFSELLDSLIGGGHFPDREQILDEDEPANLELSRLRLFEGWQPVFQPTLWERIRSHLAGTCDTVDR